MFRSAPQKASCPPFGGFVSLAVTLHNTMNLGFSDEKSNSLTDTSRSSPDSPKKNQQLSA
jgi:hypothetical protein